MISDGKNTKVLIRAIVFVILFVLLFAFLEAFTYDYSTAYDGWAYVYTDDIDILIMGSSEAHASFDAPYITEQTGKSTVILSSGAQSAKQIYFNLIEVLKYQKPELIIVEEFSVVEDTLSWMRENNLYGLALANLDGMKMSPLKLRAAFSTLGFEGYGVFHIMREAGKTERFIYSVQHMRSRLTHLFDPERKELSPTRGTVLTIPESTATVTQYEESLTREIDKSYEIPKENIIYMDKIIELCSENGIELEFIKTPLIKNASSISGHYAIQKHLEEMGYDIKTYNLMDTSLGGDYLYEDFADLNHVSASGMQKVSDWFVKHINNR